MYAYFGNFSCPNSTKMAKITWPVSMATRFKSHNCDTSFWHFALNDTSCANFIKIGDYRFPPILEILRSLQRSHFKVSFYVSTTWLVSLLMEQGVPKGTYNLVLMLIRIVLRESKFSVFKMDCKCNVYGLWFHLFWLQLFLALMEHHFSPFFTTL